MSTARHYPTDMSDAPWEALQLVLPPPTWHPGGPGRKPRDIRPIIHGMFYVNKTGWQWRRLPHEFGPWETVYGSLRRWRRAGHRARVMDILRQWARQSQGRLSEPSAGCADSQSISSATQDQDIGFDGHKQSTGRKRHILLDTLGFIVAGVVTAAHTEDRLGLVALLKQYLTAGVTRLRQIGVDAGYDAQWLRAWVGGLKHTHTIDLEVVEHTGKGFQVVKHRWKGERTLAWLLNDRRQSRD